MPRLWPLPVRPSIHPSIHPHGEICTTARCVWRLPLYCASCVASRRVVCASGQLTDSPSADRSLDSIHVLHLAGRVIHCYGRPLCLACCSTVQRANRPAAQNVDIDDDDGAVPPVKKSAIHRPVCLSYEDSRSRLLMLLLMMVVVAIEEKAMIRRAERLDEPNVDTRKQVVADANERHQEHDALSIHSGPDWSIALAFAHCYCGGRSPSSFRHFYRPLRPHARSTFRLEESSSLFP
jgi:hypothetical protein